MTPTQHAALQKRVNISEFGILTKREFMERAQRAGWAVKAEDLSGFDYGEFNRHHFNRMTSGQAEYEARLSKVKTRYSIHPPGERAPFYAISRAEYEYFNTLQVPTAEEVEAVEPIAPAGDRATGPGALESTRTRQTILAMNTQQQRPVWQDVKVVQTKIDDIRRGDHIARDPEIIFKVIRADEPEKVIDWVGFWPVVKITRGTYEDGQEFITLQGPDSEDIYRRYTGKLISKVTPA